MARQYGKRKQNQIVTLYGFSDWVEKIQRAVNTDIDRTIGKCFDKCANIVDAAIVEQMSKQSVPDSLRSKKSIMKEHYGNTYIFSDGWLRRDEKTFLKVCWLNYGTPRRQTRTGANRGKIKARYFITNAKRSAAQRVRKVQKEALDEIIKGLEK